ncbi:MAG TPA: hypothetical protein VHT28_03435, partial [Silvibacterium sp.]|nr:hypothetical protein [Silvibacterium sp.]
QHVAKGLARTNQIIRDHCLNPFGNYYSCFARLLDCHVKWALRALHYQMARKGSQVVGRG